MHPDLWMQRIVLVGSIRVWTDTVLEKCFCIIRIMNLRDRGGGEQTANFKHRVFPKVMYVWLVDWTVTTHSDYFVGKDTSERMVSTLWRHHRQEASEFLCTQTHLLGGSRATKKITKKHRKCFFLRATNVMFWNFRCWRLEKNPAVCWNRASRGYN